MHSCWGIIWWRREEINRKFKNELKKVIQKPAFIFAGANRVSLPKHCQCIDSQERPLQFANLICQELQVTNIDFQSGNLLHVDFEDKSFNKVTCFDVIEHLPPN